MLASAGEDGAVRLWDVRRFKSNGAVQLDHRDPVRSVAFSPGGGSLATASGRTVRLWSTKTHRPLGRALVVQSGAVNAVAFSPDGRRLASAGADGRIRLWDLASRREIAQPLRGREGATSVAFSPSGDTLVTNDNQSVRLWDVSTHSQTGATFKIDDRDPLVTAMATSGDLLGVATSGGKTRVWDLASRRRVGDIKRSPIDPSTGEPFPVHTLAVSPEEQVIATAGADRAIRLWNSRTLQPVGRPLVGHTREVISVAFSADGKMLASVAEGSDAIEDIEGKTNTIAGDHTVRLWDARSHAFIRAVTTQADHVRFVVFPRDGRTVAAVSDQGVETWDTASGEIVGRLDQPVGDDDVTATALSADGKYYARATSDQNVTLWEVTTGRRFGPQLSSEDPVQSMAFSVDGRVLAVGALEIVGESTRGQATLWDLDTGLAFGPPLIGHEYLTQVTFDAESTTLITAGDRTIRPWDVSYLASVDAFLCRRIGGSLSPAEWQRLIPSGPAYRPVC